jgi:hypothetical protein
MEECIKCIFLKETIGSYSVCNLYSKCSSYYSVNIFVYQGITSIIWFFFEIQSCCLAEVSLEFATYPRLASDSWFYCLSLPSTGIIGMHHHAQLYNVIFKSWKMLHYKYVPYFILSLPYFWAFWLFVIFFLFFCGV